MDELYLGSTFVMKATVEQGSPPCSMRARIEIAASLNAKKLTATIYRGNKFYLKWFLKHGFKVQAKDEVKDTIQVVYEPKIA